MTEDFDSPRSCRILLADGDPRILGLLSSILETECEIVGTASDGEALIAGAESMKPDLIIADIWLPVLNALNAWKTIHQRNTQVKIVFLALHNEPGYIRAALDAGASGWVLKTSAPTELSAAIHAVLEGRSYVSHDLAS